MDALQVKKPDWIIAVDDKFYTHVSSTPHYDYFLIQKSCWVDKKKGFFNKVYFIFKEKDIAKDTSVIGVGVTSKLAFIENKIDILRRAYFDKDKFINQDTDSWFSFGENFDCPIKKIAKTARKEAVNNIEYYRGGPPDYIMKFKESPYGNDFVDWEGYDI